ncbi:MAG: hypothetical protein RL685_3824 [Pseudomonadota bacterium]
MEGRGTVPVFGPDPRFLAGLCSRPTTFRGVGVTLWDLEANHEFDEAHDPAGSVGRGRGRFVTLFGHQTAEGGDAAFNIAVFRDFVAEREVGASADPEAIDVDISTVV